MTFRNAVSVVTVAVFLVTDQRSVQGQIYRANDRKLVLCIIPHTQRRIQDFLNRWSG